MKSKALQTLWWDWLGTSERLLRSLHEQTAALVLRDVPRVERIQPELDQMLVKLREIDEQAAACAKTLAEEVGSEPNLRSMVLALETAEAQQVQSLANRVMVAARNVEQVIDKNKRLLEHELDYVNGTMTLIARAAVDQRSPFSTAPGRAAVLLDQAA